MEWLAPERGGFFVDATLGAGGHAEALLARGPALELLGIDRDPDALARAADRLARFPGRVRLVEADFGDLESVLEGSPAPDGILADLGVSSMQLDQGERGFSFRRDGPLDMRMGRSGRSAADIVATASVEELTRIFRDFGEERMAAKIARGIVAERTRGPIQTTRQLARIVAGEKGTREKIDPATRVFQALRIEVNQELVALARFLAAAVGAPERGRPPRGHLVPLPRGPDRQGRLPPRVGRLPVPAEAAACVCGARTALKVLTRRPIRPGEAELARNPRSRSARLRVAEKVADPAETLAQVV